MFGNKNKPEAGITLIASNCEITGDLHFSDQLQVNGIIKGNINAEDGTKALVTISEKGRVEGDIRVPNVVVNGKVDGDIYADKHIELAAKAEITGNVFYNLIEMVMGSRVEGKLVHCKKGIENSPLPDSRPQHADEGASSAESVALETRPQVTAVPGKIG